mmetsp:Transcript_28117/g.41730  ORF Transcript_28117/g.41730 Transcript_28117/m.41730 type:complete len:106 (+) Transcript_28117:23-340(+)
MVNHASTPRGNTRFNLRTVLSVNYVCIRFLFSCWILSLATSVEQRISYPVISQPITESLQTHFPLKYIHEPTKILALEAFSPSSMSIKTSDPSTLLHHPPSFAQP